MTMMKTTRDRRTTLLDLRNRDRQRLPDVDDAVHEALRHGKRLLFVDTRCEGARCEAAAGGIGDRGRAGDGIGRDRDRNQRYAAAVVVST